MGEQTLCEQATDTTIDRLTELSGRLAELHDALLSGDPDEILRVAQATCLLADGLERSETATLCADYVDNEKLSMLLADAKKQSRLCLIVASCALRVGGRTMAAMRGTSAYGPSGERVLKNVHCGLSEAG